MSTFNGLVAEFPHIRIDFFRKHVKAPQPLACFLSHVHSDHLAGLDSLRSPFVYCSAATRQILLRLERYPCRINYARGILESRQQTYKHLQKILKALPLETQVCLELAPGHEIQVTLFDANHCPGAVMFLIEGDGKAILYTGDVRSEPWFVNSLTRNPNLIAYTSGIRSLDTIYLDTSFTDNVPFQTKAEGLEELLRKISQYPDDTIFHIRAWTYGYEDVWVALSRFLNSPIHVDDYKLRIYNSLRASASDGVDGERHMTRETPALVGYMCGNSPQFGCLTSNEHVRLHSCEKGNMCQVAKGSQVVSIQPIIAHLPGGQDLTEVGVGGGGDDLERHAELALAENDEFFELFAAVFSDKKVSSKETIDSMQKALKQMVSNGRDLFLNLDSSAFDGEQSTELDDAILCLIEKLEATSSSTVSQPHTENLPRTIRFPYSRHSSYPELCHLIQAFQPKDIWPCTVDASEWSRKDISIKGLFGQHCSNNVFEHDEIVKSLVAQKESEAASRETPFPVSQLLSQSERETSPLRWSSPSTRASPAFDGERHPGEPTKALDPKPPEHPPPASTFSPEHPKDSAILVTSNRSLTPGRLLYTVEAPGLAPDAVAGTAELPAQKRRFADFAADDHVPVEAGDSQQSRTSVSSSLSTQHSATRREAYQRMLENAYADVWQPLGLLSTDCHHTTADQEL